MNENLTEWRGVLFLKIRTKIARTISRFKPPLFPMISWLGNFKAIGRSKNFDNMMKKHAMVSVVYQRLNYSAEGFQYLALGFGTWSFSLNNLHLDFYLPWITNRTDLFITICTVCQAGTNISFGSRYVSYFGHCIGVGRVTPTSSFEVTISCPTFPKGPELAGILGSTLLLEF